MCSLLLDGVDSVIKSFQGASTLLEDEGVGKSVLALASSWQT